MDEFEIDCEECGTGCLVHSYELPDFCPLCGRRAEAEKLHKEVIEYED